MIPKDGITFEELVNRIQNEELIEQINHVLEVQETSVELAHRQQLIKILYEAVCKLIDGYLLASKTIDELSHEKEVKSARINYLADTLRTKQNIINEQASTIEALTAENERLRKYLEEYDKDYAKKHGIV